MNGTTKVIPDPTPRFSSHEAAQIAHENFGLTGHIAPLPSERDQNFLLEVPGRGKFVLKIAKADEDRAELEFQNAALGQVALRAPALAVPRLSPTRLGEELTQIKDRGGRAHYIRMISWLEGQMLADVETHGEELLASLGNTMAEIDLALQGFSHAAMYRELRWNLKCADLALAHLPLLPAEQQRLVRLYMEAWSHINWTTLRHGVIHGDANDHNVLVRQGRVAGLIDFGDLVHSAMVCDLAIASAYAMLGKARPMEAAATVVRAYHLALPLQTSELDALYSLIGARLSMSLCYAAHNAQVKRADAYQQVSAGPAWTLMQQMAEVSIPAARALWDRACGLQ